MPATLISPFASPPGVQQQDLPKRPMEAANSHKRYRGLNEFDQSTTAKDLSSIFCATQSIPELLQPISDIPSRSTSFMNDTKMPELMKPFEPEPTLTHRASLGPLTNGVDNKPSISEFPDPQEFSKICQEFTKPTQEFQKTQDFSNNALEFNKRTIELPRTTVELQRIPDFPKIETLKSTPDYSKNHPDFVKQELQEFLVTQDSVDYPKQEQREFSDVLSPVVIKKEIKSEPLEEFSRTKSAQSISALLQEPLAPMPSLLQQFSQPPQQSQEFPPTLTPILTSELPVSQESLVSTVDMGALSGSTIDSTFSATSVPTLLVPIEEKKSEHHKSEKKKKEKKHKHKDKDKSKEKHKHKHKDKDKERHRDKDKKKAEQGENVPTEPIKITIPKDKINLSSESLGSGDKLKSPPGKIKIKIAKERLKVAEAISASPVTPVQGPLKIKIRTDALSRSSSSANDSTHESRKRERSDGHESASTSGPPTKKLQSMSIPGLVQQRSNERQNGRHYNSGSNNKVRGSGRGGHYFSPRGPYAPQQLYEGFYQRCEEPYQGARGPRNHPLHHPNSQRGDSFFFSNYPPLPIYNPAGYMYDPAIYYQQYQQQHRFNIYPAGNVIVTPEGTIDTSVPPPALPPNLRNTSNKCDGFTPTVSKAESSSLPDEPPPLPDGPPPNSLPPPPPPPPE